MLSLTAHRDIQRFTFRRNAGGGDLWVSEWVRTYETASRRTWSASMEF